ncbi:MAG TPA: hypothetical protein VGC99_09985 [Candidatus Tectomicrobia bacterium]
METVVGIFSSHAGLERAIERVRALGILQDHINCLLPSASSAQLETVPTTDAEQPGMGKVLGGVVGGVTGASHGLLGAAVVSALVPGVGPVMTIGLAAAALLGVGGVVAGAAVGGALEHSLEIGLPKDELFFYEDALRQGRTVLIVLTEQQDQAEAVHEALAEAGAESIDAARERWWLGVRDAEAEVYTAEGLDFTTDEPLYRQGFEAALQPATAGKSYAEALEFLQTRYPDVYREEAFRHGYARGQTYSEGLRGKYQG